jgi:hypothetical protein
VPEEMIKKTRKFFQTIKEVVYGFMAHDSTSYALRNRAIMEHLFMLITVGDMLGVPIFPPYYSFRLLPYMIPKISNWKRRMLKEKDLTFEAFGEIRGA